MLCQLSYGPVLLYTRRMTRLLIALPLVLLFGCPTSKPAPKPVPVETVDGAQGGEAPQHRPGRPADLEKLAE